MPRARRDFADLARRYVGWLRQRALGVMLASVALLGGAVFLIVFHLPLRADFSYLLPQEAPAVRDLRKLEARVRSTDAILVIVEGPAADDGDQGLAQVVLAAAEHGARAPPAGRLVGDPQVVPGELGQ